MYVYEYNGQLFDDEGIATLVAENWMEMAVRVFGDSLRDFLDELPCPILDDIKDWLLEDVSGRVCWDIVGVRVKEVMGREAATDYGSNEL